MSEERKVSEELLGAFVDGQLVAAEWAQVAAQVDGDADLREEVCRLRAVKERLRHAYASPPARGTSPRRAGKPGWMGLAAASALFALAGWFGHAQWNQPPVLDSASAYALRGDWHSLRSDWGSLQGGKVLVHVSSAGREALGAALDEIEDLLRESSREHRSLEVEIVANGPGLDLFQASDTLLAPRLAAMRRDYPALSLVACRQTLERRRARGQPVELAPDVSLAPSALHEVVERLRAGWVYVRV
jgi:intracellular sulfur oxidation DsrE/DsrF family protein